MKRTICALAAGALLALASAGTAVASGGLPIVGQEGTQSASFGDQTVEEQRNDADVTQWQGNGNVNVSPSIALLGDASTKNEQGNGNTAYADVDQSNTATQSQDATQSQYLGDSGSTCCDDQSQTGKQETSFGPQTVGKQRNDAEVTQKQGNGNVNVSPAIAIFGDASTWNAQGNHNKADADVKQDNTAEQSQSAYQKQRVSGDGGACCKHTSKCKYHDGCKSSTKYQCRDRCQPKTEWRKPKECCGGQSQTGEQHVYGGEQTVGKQRNDADVTQKQGNGNVNVSPALAVGFPKHERCSKSCSGKHTYDGSSGASSSNAQGNGNRAYADVEQSNTATQSQSAKQFQKLWKTCKGVISR